MQQKDTQLKVRDQVTGRILYENPLNKKKLTADHMDDIFVHSINEEESEDDYYEEEIEEWQELDTYDAYSNEVRGIDEE